MDANDGVLSLREAIDAANSNPTTGQHLIQFATALKGSSIAIKDQLPTFAENIYLCGPVADAYAASATDRITINRVPVLGGPVNYRLLEVDPGSVSTVAGLVLTGGDPLGSGGAIYSRGNLTVTGCWIKDNESASGGGGISPQEGALTVYDTRFESNQAGADGAPPAPGGAITVGSGVSVTVTGSTFYLNSATGAGGAIYFVGGSSTAVASLTLDNDEFSTNYAGTAGGAIFCDSYSNLTLKGGTWIYWNSVTDTVNGKGGGVYIKGAGSTIHYLDVTIESNTAASGSGVYRRNDVTRDDGTQGVDPGVTFAGGNSETVGN